MEKKKIIRYALVTTAVVVGMLLSGCAIIYYLLQRPVYSGKGTLELYIDADDTRDSVCQKIDASWMMSYLVHSNRYTVRTGYYQIPSGQSVISVFRSLRSGHQTPVKVTIPSVRTLDRLAARLSETLMLDSATLVRHFTDSAFCARYGYTRETMPALFIPNTYECYWDVSLERLMQRLEQVNKEFWNEARQKKAAALGFTHEQVITLASIVDSETANNGEKARVAGLYLNRLKKNMLLQADPTVIFAVGDFTIRRVLNEHTSVESPYNTYLHKGLPPGPIRIPSVAGIDAVLNHEEHTYLYMCAKEDFSGTHNFATSYSEHQANARRYQKALNERNIKR